MPPAISPAAPSVASTPPVGSNISPTSSATPSRARRTKASIRRLYAFAFGFGKGVAANVGRHVAFRRVLAEFHEAEAAVAAVVGRVREAAGLDDAVLDFAMGVGVARVGDRVFFEEFLGVGFAVFAIDAEEGDLLAVAGRELLQDRELEAA